MKRIKKVLIIISTAIILSCMVYADGIESGVIDYPHLDITIRFEDSSTIPIPKQQQIADSLVGVYTNEQTDEVENIICTLFGHDTFTTTVSATYHKVLAHEPRCKVEVYDVEACSRCNYTVKTLLGYNYISCCPEDPMN